jgi:hypothetical protein
MAKLSVCAELKQGFDFACVTDTVRKYFQQIVVINFSDIDRGTVVKTNTNTPTCAFNVAFKLKTGKTGYAIIGAETGNSISGMYEKTTNELTGQPNYLHKINYVGVGVSEAVKCILNSLDRGSFVVACQLKNGLVEIYGIDNGVRNADYSYDIQGGNGGSAIVMQSEENALESLIPMNYKPTAPSLSAGADFDLLFANP